MTRQRGQEVASITCPRCGMTSHHPADVEQGYCGNCHDWTTPRTTRKPGETWIISSTSDLHKRNP